MRLRAAWATDVGRVRSGNEDSLLIDEDLGVFAIADGMGGHRGGEVASSTAVEAVRVALANGDPIDRAIRAANAAIRERASGDPEVAGMGTTFTAVVTLDDANLLIGHVGDSRAYLLRAGDLTKLTRDHSLVEDLVRDGRITPDQAEVHPQRSIITRALGIEPSVEVDLYTVPVRDGDRIVICSDGLTDMLSERDVARLANASGEPDDAVQSLIDAANLAGGNDNITVVILEVDDVGIVDGFVDHGAALDEEPFALPAMTDPPDPGPTPHRRSIRSRAWSGRVARVGLAMLPLLLILAVGFFVVHRRATGTWFVSHDAGEVVIMRGVPGGVLWYEPEVVEATGLKTGTLTEGDLGRVLDGYCEKSTIEAARECVEDLGDRRRPVEPTTTITLPPITSATIPTAPGLSSSSTSPTTGARP